MWLWARKQGAVKERLDGHTHTHTWTEAHTHTHTHSPCAEKLFTDYVLQRDTNPWRQFPEEALRELAIQLGKEMDVKTYMNESVSG